MNLLRLFPRAMALVYMTAFASFYPQIPGLLGDNGLAPLASFFRVIHEHYGGRSYYLLPSLAWIHPTAGFLQFLAALGVVISLLAAAGFGGWLSFGVLWVLYLSMVGPGQDFMSFQWDILLLEGGF